MTQSLRQDVQLAVRLLRRSPGFAAVVILTLGLGIGANAAIFSVINSLLMRPLPVADPQRLFSLSVDSAMGRRFPAGVGWSLAIWERFQPHAAQFDGAIAWMAAGRFDLAESGERQPAEGIYTTGNYFTTLGVPALLGRTFTADDDRPGGGPDGPVAVISYRLWQRRFGGAANAIGSRMTVDNLPVTIVGVTPPEFLGVEVGRPFEVALPLRIEPLINGERSALKRNSPYLAVILRLKPDQPVDAAIAALRTVQPDILGVTRDTMSKAPERLRAPFTLNSAAFGTSGTNPFVLGLRQNYERPLFTIAIVAGLVLLIACVNIANLMLARATARRHEMSVRLALGAPRMRLARQMLIESLMLSGLGALLGMLFASWGSRVLVAQLSTSVDRIAMDLSLDWRVTMFTAAIALATAAIFGTAPAFRAANAAPIDALKGNSRTVAAAHAAATVGGAAGSRRLRASMSGSLVVAQVSLALALVIVAALFVRTFERIASVPLGFERHRVLVVNVNLQRGRVAPADRLGFSERLVEAVRMSPGVAHAGASRWTPVDRGMRAADPRRNLAFNHITPGWFAAYGTKLIAGRDFDARDTAAALPVAIVNQSYVRKFVTDGTPIGELVEVSMRGRPRVDRTIVGVVDDAVFDSQREGTQPMAYLPLAQTEGEELPGQAQINISLSAVSGTPMGLTRSVAAALSAVDGGLSFTFRPLADQVDASLTQERLVATLSGIFGALALLIAALGLYGVTSYAVQRRSSEIGIRMALGAQRGDVMGLVLRQSLTLTAIGIILGLAAAATATRYVRGMLFGLTPLDPATFAGVTIVFAIVAAAAAAIPARRATRIDPLTALRAE